MVLFLTFPWTAAHKSSNEWIVFNSKGSYLNMFFSLFMKNYKHVYDVI